MSIKIPQGFLLSAVSAKLKKKGLDLGLIVSEPKAVACGFFTKNKNVSYSVTVSKANLKNKIKAVIVNSGNANCFTHKEGVKDTKKITVSLADQLNVDQKNILIASTGIIGKKLDTGKIKTALFNLIKKSGKSHKDFAKSIMTTDTVEKICFKSFKINGKEVRILGFAKGAGMIAPNMATMLGFVITDAKISKPLLNNISKEAVSKSFNAITVDGCSSTNDTVFVLANGQSGIVINSKNKAKFKKAIDELMLDLAKKIIKDAEGATKFITLKVEKAKSEKQAEISAKQIANSMLFKTAIYGKNANWGRVVQSLGQVGIKVDEKKFKVKCSSLDKKEVGIVVSLAQGNKSYTVYTSDLTPEYVEINAGYS